MFRTTSIIFFTLLAGVVQAQPKYSVHWEELTAGDFVEAIKLAQNTCVLPFGILEKHGPHLPLGTDLINARYAAIHGAEQEYAIVYPEYYFGQIFEAKHEPGTIAYSAKLQMELLQETVDEMSRNGCKKIIIANGHGGNTNFLQYFAQIQLEKPRDTVIYVQWGGRQDTTGRPAMKSAFDMHAGEAETASTMVSRPELVHLDRAASESGADLKRLDLPSGLYTGIWWYARFPNHYAGDGSVATKELGEFDQKAAVARVAAAIRAVKADQITPRLQKEFFEKSERPLETKQ